MIQIFLAMLAWKKGKRFLFSMCLLLLGYLSGCGGGDNGIGERLSGPASDAALPIRIDATVTPTSTPTPESEFFPEEDLPIDEIQLSSTPLSKEELISPTPTSSLAQLPEEDAETELPESELTPIPSPLPMPTPTPTAKAASEADPASSPDRSQKSSKDSMKVTEASEKNSSGKQTTPEPEKKSQKTSPKAKVEPEQKSESEQAEDQEETQTDDEQDDSSEAVVNSSEIRLDRVVICSKVTNRNPVNVTNKFSLSEVGKIYTWMQVSGVKPPKTVKHIYYWEGKVIARVTLKLKYASMRTWSEKTFKLDESLGKWKVVITTNNEKEILAVKEFTVTP